MQEIQVMDSDSSLIVINLQKSPSHQCRRALAPCWMECGGKNGDILDSTLARQTFFELNSKLNRAEDNASISQRTLCRHSCRWWRCQLNLSPGIHIQHEPANKYRTRNSIDALQEICAGDIWRNLATMRAEKSVCETWKIRGRVSAPWLHPVTCTPTAIVKIAAIGRLLRYYALILEFFRILLVMDLVFSNKKEEII